MSVPDETARLVRVLEREAVQLGELAAAMQQQRAAFVALRPAALDTGIQTMAAQAIRAAELARERERVLEALGAQLRAPGRPTLAALDLRLPAELRPALARAADAVRAAARRVRIEGRIGGRLLQESRRWHRALLGGDREDRRSATVYDRRAHARAPQPGAGSLLRGTM
jgi:hypothetical protein